MQQGHLGLLGAVRCGRPVVSCRVSVSWVQQNPVSAGLPSSAPTRSQYRATSSSDEATLA
jgi:hypothetical protein